MGLNKPNKWAKTGQKGIKNRLNEGGITGPKEGPKYAHKRVQSQSENLFKTGAKIGQSYAQRERKIA